MLTDRVSGCQLLNSLYSVMPWISIMTSHILLFVVGWFCCSFSSDVFVCDMPASLLWSWRNDWKWRICPQSNIPLSSYVVEILQTNNYFFQILISKQKNIKINFIEHACVARARADLFLYIKFFTYIYLYKRLVTLSCNHKHEREIFQVRFRF